MAKADKVSIVWSGRLGNVPLVECRRVGYRYRYRNLFISGENRKTGCHGGCNFWNYRLVNGRASFPRVHARS